MAAAADGYVECDGRGEYPDDPAGHARRIVADVRITGLRARGYTFVTVSDLLSRAAVLGAAR
ncbi:hypothetical protein AB0F68_18300 [Micromonospora sp. NPDC023966]|uniref:hypothetical protein n=1 Tax=Micromonospora sp. NPDC023966 TaxID=3154699 RepID=UPI0034007774